MCVNKERASKKTLWMVFLLDELWLIYACEAGSNGVILKLVKP